MRLQVGPMLGLLLSLSLVYPLSMLVTISPFPIVETMYGACDHSFTQSDPPVMSWVRCEQAQFCYRSEASWRRGRRG